MSIETVTIQLSKSYIRSGCTASLLLTVEKASAGDGEDAVEANTKVLKDG